MDTKIDYSDYSFDDLIDIKNNIDKDIKKYQGKYNNILMYA